MGACAGPGLGPGINRPIIISAGGKLAGPGGRVQFRTLSEFGVRRASLAALEGKLIVRSSSKAWASSLGMFSRSPRRKSLAGGSRAAYLGTRSGAFGRRGSFKRIVSSLASSRATERRLASVSQARRGALIISQSRPSMRRSASVWGSMNAHAARAAFAILNNEGVVRCATKIIVGSDVFIRRSTFFKSLTEFSAERKLFAKIRHVYKLKRIMDVYYANRGIETRNEES